MSVASAKADFWLMIVSIAIAVFPVYLSPIISSLYPLPIGTYKIIRLGIIQIKDLGTEIIIFKEYLDCRRDNLPENQLI